MNIGRERAALIGIRNKHFIDEKIVEFLRVSDTIGTRFFGGFFDQFQREIDADIGFNQNSF